MGYTEEYDHWCNSPVFDRATREELRALSDENEIKDRFYKQLSFGTGGLRGIIGAGTNRMNFYTVGKATQGLADYIRSVCADGSVVIAYDSRIMSAEFALDSACILAANGIKAYLFDGLRPTPELSFAVRYLHATAGIVITASHNPPQYNGYKVYFSDGGQIVPPYDQHIIDAVNAVGDYSNIRRISAQDAENKKLLVSIGAEIDDAYIASLKRLILSPEELNRYAKEIRIVYTPLHGTGNVHVQRILKELGFQQVWVVPEQEAPNGAFPTVKSPNPENPSAFQMALALAEKIDADLVLATDPDADRLGVYAKGKTGEYHRFSGNMSGLLIAEYELSRKETLGLLPKRRKDGALVTTVVSSKMAYPLAEEYGVTVLETLTGFKYIGEQIKRFEKAKAENNGQLSAEKGAYEFLFGYEESYGCLIGTYARDKDAVAAVMALCEAAAYYRSQQIGLWDQMIGIYEKYGYYAEDLIDQTFYGAEGVEKIAAIIEDLRKFPATLGGYRVLAVRDYQRGIRTDCMTGTETKTSLPQSNVLYFELENDGWCCVRPSGTEPKIKLYFGAKDSTQELVQTKICQMREQFYRLIMVK